MIKVLPSTYRMVQFRSRLEARWAVYFDLIGLPWQYEPEGYHLDVGNYCPDFLCRGEEGFFVEVKPTAKEFQLVKPKLLSLCRMTGREVYCVVGAPSLKGQWGCSPEHGDDDMVPGVFCHYAFTYKNWGCPFYGEMDDYDEHYWRIASNMRFENGAA